MEQIELKEFVQKVIADIEASIEIEKRSVLSPIKFEISVCKTHKMGGDLKIFVASSEGSVEKESIAKISFEVWPHDPAYNRVSQDSYESFDLRQQGGYSGY